jgi:hypothetical protein
MPGRAEFGAKMVVSSVTRDTQVVLVSSLRAWSTNSRHIRETQSLVAHGHGLDTFGICL